MGLFTCILDTIRDFKNLKWYQWYNLNKAIKLVLNWVNSLLPGSLHISFIILIKVEHLLSKLLVLMYINRFLLRIWKVIFKNFKILYEKNSEDQKQNLMSLPSSNVLIFYNKFSIFNLYLHSYRTKSYIFVFGGLRA